jgi:hypothetical protein
MAAEGEKLSEDDYRWWMAPAPALGVWLRYLVRSRFHQMSRIKFIKTMTALATAIIELRAHEAA